MDIEGSNQIINPAQQVHGREEIAAGIEVLESGHWAEGIKSLEFRFALSKYIGIKNVTLTNSGSSANLAAIMALTTHWIPEDRRLVEGSEVITPALCFPTTVSPIIYAGAIPVFVDVDRTWGIDTEQVEKAITDKTRVIITAHNLGNPVQMDKLRDICSEHNLYLITDCCDALGCRWDGERSRAIGHIGTLSFYPAHHISCGEGGAVFTKDPEIHKAIKSMVNWGRDCWCEPGHDNTCGRRYKQQLGGLPYGYDHKNTFAEMGFNLKMTDIQAAIGIEQLKRVNGFIQVREDNHKFFWEYFSKMNGWFELPMHYPEAMPSWFGYVVKLKEGTPFTRDEMVLDLDKAGIRSRAFFCGNITRQPCLWKKGGYRVVGDLRISDEIMNNAFWIGVHPGIGEEQRRYMIQVLDNFLNKYK